MVSSVDRIRLAEAMGARWVESHKGRDDLRDFIDAKGERYPDFVSDGQEPIPNVFRPHADANDCEALVRWLRTKGFTTTVQFHVQGGFWVELANWHDAEHKLSLNTDDWKQGVCELALKVIDSG